MTTMPTETTPTKQHRPDYPAYWLKKIEPKFDLFASVDDYRKAVQAARKYNQRHVRLQLKAGLVNNARALLSCDGADKPCGRGDCYVCGLQYDRALNAEMLQLLAAHEHRGFVVGLNLRIDALTRPNVKSDYAIDRCHQTLRHTLDSGGYSGTSIIGGFTLAHRENQGIWWFEMPLVIFGATNEQLGGLWDNLGQFGVEHVEKISSSNFDISDFTQNFCTYGDRVESYHAFGDGIESPTPAQLFRLRWYNRLRLENCTFRYGSAQADGEKAA